MISFAGPLTFPNADGLRRVAAAVPLERTLIETDCPHLAPQPVRGRRNEPAHLVHVAEALARLHGVDPATASSAMMRAVRMAFDRLPAIA